MGLHGNGANGNGENGERRIGQGYSVPLKSYRVPVRKPPVPKYPRKGWDFPRRGVEITPDEILYDPARILGTRVKASLTSTGETVLVQPRIESTGLLQRQEINDCPPPSQLPVIKRQIHLDPSRDAEILSIKGKVDVPAGGTATVLRFTTFNNLRHFIKWASFTVFDALDPEAMTFTLMIDGTPRKGWADPNSTISGGGYDPVIVSVPSTPTAVFPCLPTFQNSLVEITDLHDVEIRATNADPFADRKVEVCLWGWIESVTVWDETVKR